MNEIILSLDLSLKSTGFCVYYNKKFIIGNLFFEKSLDNKIIDFFQKQKIIINEIKQIVKKYNPSCIILEGISFFSKGNVFAEIFSLNYIVRNYIIQNLQKEQILIITPPKVFKKIFLDGNAKKKEIIEKVNKEIKFDLFSLKQFKKKDDIADSIMFILCYLKNKDQLINKSVVITKNDLKKNNEYKKEIVLI